MALNGYSYVHGNPTNWTDPSGEIPPMVIGGILGGLFGGGREVYSQYHYWKTAQPDMGFLDILLKCVDRTDVANEALKWGIIGAAIGASVGIYTGTMPGFYGFLGEEGAKNFALGMGTNIFGGLVYGRYDNVSTEELIAKILLDSAIGGSFALGLGKLLPDLHTGNPYISILERANWVGIANAGQNVTTKFADRFIFGFKLSSSDVLEGIWKDYFSGFVISGAVDSLILGFGNIPFVRRRLRLPSTKSRKGPFPPKNFGFHNRKAAKSYKTLRQFYAGTQFDKKTHLSGYLSTNLLGLPVSRVFGFLDGRGENLIDLFPTMA